MKKLVTLKTLKINADWKTVGSTVEVEDDFAQQLVSRGLAEEWTEKSDSPVPREPVSVLPENGALVEPKNDEFAAVEEQEMTEEESKEKAADEVVTPMTELTSIPGVGKPLAQALIEAGYDSKEKIRTANPKKVLVVKGMTQRILDVVRK